MPFEPVTAANLSDAAADQIRTLIATDVLRPGDQLPGERELADRMQVSRTSIRSALQSLVSEGMLISRHGSGFRVSDEIGQALVDPLVRLLENAPDAISDYLQFRAILEGDSAGAVAEKAGPEELTEIERLHLEMQSADRGGDRDRAAALDVEFHMAIVETTGNVVSIQIARSLHELLRRSIQRSHGLVYDDPAARTDLINQHARIVVAIKSRDGDGARAAMRDHLAYQEALIKRKTDEDLRRATAGKRKSWAMETQR